MKITQTKKWAGYAAIVLLLGSLLLGGCANITPTDQPPFSLTPGQTSGQDVKVTYNYNDTDKVQLSANDIVLKVGQKLVLSSAPGFTGSTRFASSGEYFFGDIMKQEDSQQQSGKVVFTAQKPGKGKLQIIPNTNDLDRAVDLWVTVQ